MVRVIVATTVLVVAFVLAVAWGPGWAFGAQPMWSVTVLAALVAAAGAGATFVPRPGEARPVHVGCGPCVLVDALAAVAGAWLALTSAYDAGTAALALALTGFALARRVTAPSACHRDR